MSRFQYKSFSFFVYLGLIVGAMKGYEFRGVVGMLLLGLFYGVIGQYVGKSGTIIIKILLFIFFVLQNNFLREYLSYLFSELGGF